MSGVIRKSAVVAASAALALGGVAGPAAAAHHANKGHHKHWTTAKCEKQLAQWQKSHKHPTMKQSAAERNLLQKHGCPTTG